MQEWQERLVTEQAELSEKIVKLVRFETTPEYRALPDEDRELLDAQHAIMLDYNSILNSRIARFESGAGE